MYPLWLSQSQENWSYLGSLDSCSFIKCKYQAKNLKRNMQILAKMRNTTFFEMSKFLQINYATMKTSKTFFACTKE